MHPRAARACAALGAVGAATLAVGAHPAVGAGAPPTLDAAPPTLDAAPPTLDAAPPTLDAAPPTLEAAPPTLDGAPPTLEAAPPTLDGAPPTLAVAAVAARTRGFAERLDGQLVRGGSALSAAILLARHRPHHAGRDAVIIRVMIAAGNRIARLPYVWGGGHGSFTASGYDCSGSVSYVLHAAGLLSTPEDSTGLEGFGDPGPGKYVTIYASSSHAWMTINRRRFDTVALQESGTRWSSTVSSSSGYVVRHPRGM
jgi:cell wall-associated NlpC family hydrolase